MPTLVSFSAILCGILNYLRSFAYVVFKVALQPCHRSASGSGMRDDGKDQYLHIIDTSSHLEYKGLYLAELLYNCPFLLYN